MKTISVLSHKGGVGKTSIAVNIASYLAKQGKNVLLLDLDFHGPSIHTFFPANVSWINDYLFKDVSFSSCINEVKFDDMKGRLFIAYTDPTSDAIQDILKMDQKKSIRMLQNLLQIKKLILDIEKNTDYIVIDSSPGAGFSTVNIMFISDISLFLIKLSNADIIGTSQMIDALYSQIQAIPCVIANQIPDSVYENKEELDRVNKLITKRFNNVIGKDIVKFLGWIPTDLNLQVTEFQEGVNILENKASKRKIFTIDEPDHIFAKELIKMISSLDGISL